MKVANLASSVSEESTVSTVVCIEGTCEILFSHVSLMRLHMQSHICKKFLMHPIFFPVFPHCDFRTYAIILSAFSLFLSHICTYHYFHHSPHIDIDIQGGQRLFGLVFLLISLLKIKTGAIFTKNGRIKLQFLHAYKVSIHGRFLHSFPAFLGPESHTFPKNPHIKSA